MSEVIMIVSPGKWVSEEQLIALKGIKKGTLKKAREKSFMEGREYKHVAHDGMPWDNSPCFYNLEEIDRKRLVRTVLIFTESSDQLS
ncbi:excisionase family protein, partial [Escherichia coli]|uniref:excisionase family protein n=1 Tax=Escherichia coli TaxID=562 RepID=UPI000BCD7410